MTGVSLLVFYLSMLTTSVRELTEKTKDVPADGLNTTREEEKHSTLTHNLKHPESENASEHNNGVEVNKDLHTYHVRKYLHHFNKSYYLDI